MDIREATVLIIRKGNEFLVGTICFSTDLRWSISPWDAWTTRETAGGGCGREGGWNGDAVQSSGKADPGSMLAMIMKQYTASKEKVTHYEDRTN